MTCIEEERVVNLISTCHGVTVPTIFGNLTKICFEDGFESQNASKGDFLKPSGWFESLTTSIGSKPGMRYCFVNKNIGSMIYDPLCFRKKNTEKTCLLYEQQPIHITTSL